MALRSAVLFEDVFKVDALNPEGKKFENVSRVVAKGLTYEMELVVDVHAELYPIKTKDEFTMALASTLDLQGNPDDDTYNQSGELTLLDKFDYCMHGKIFSYEHVGESKVAVYISYGGLLMKLVGDQRHLQSLELDSRVYALMRKYKHDGVNYAVKFMKKHEIIKLKQVVQLGVSHHVDNMMGYTKDAHTSRPDLTRAEAKEKGLN